MIDSKGDTIDALLEEEKRVREVKDPTSLLLSNVSLQCLESSTTYSVQKLNEDHIELQQLQFLDDKPFVLQNTEAFVVQHSILGTRYRKW
jgi:hypothetical protein